MWLREALDVAGACQPALSPQTPRGLYKYAEFQSRIPRIELPISPPASLFQRTYQKGKLVSQLPSFSAMVSIIFDDEMFNNNTIFSSGQEVKVQLLGL